MKKPTLAIVIIFIVSFFASIKAQDTINNSNVQTSIGEKIEKTRGPSPYIKTPKPVDDEVLAPKPKDREKARGNWCKIVIDNWTGYTVDIYADGDYAGTVAAWDDFDLWPIEGKTQLYAESVGGTVFFGPVYFDCGRIDNLWRLNAEQTDDIIR